MLKARCITVILSVAVLCALTATGSAWANWTYTSSDPIVWEFDDLGNNSWANPNGGSYIEYAASPHSTVQINHALTHTVSGTTWTHTASSTGTWGTGSLKIQSSGNHVGRSYSDSMNGMGTNTFAANPPGAELDWARGAVFEVRAKLVGAAGTEPDGYSWGKTTAKSGMHFWFRNLVNAPGAPAGSESVGMQLCWITNDPAKTSDDEISVMGNFSEPVASVKTSLGGDAVNAPEHTFKWSVRRSPLPLQPSNRVALVNVWMDGNLVIRNRTGAGSASSYDMVVVGVREDIMTYNACGNEYDYVKVYEGDPLPADSDNPTLPANLVGQPTKYSTTLVWNASTDATSDVIGYRIYMDGQYRGYVDWANRKYTFNNLVPGSSHTYEVLAVDAVGNVSAPATVTVQNPTSTSWSYTSSSPVVFEFADNVDSSYTVTQSFYGWLYTTAANAPYNDVVINYSRSPLPDPATSSWTHRFSSLDSGDLTIQSNPDHTSISSSLCLAGNTENNVTNRFGINKPGQELDWGRGIVIEAKAASIGGSATAPSGYTWGPNKAYGGILYNFGSIADNNPSAPAGSEGSSLGLHWQTNDPTTSSDDQVGFIIPSQPIIAAAFPFSASANASNAPVNEFKLITRVSPLPVPTRNDTVLVTAMVDGVPVPGLTNRTISTRSAGTGDYLQIGAIRTDTATGAVSRGDKFDWIKFYQADPVADTDNPSSPIGLTASNVQISSVTLNWSAATDATTSVIGYRVYRNGAYQGYTEASTLTFVDTTVTDGSTYSYQVEAVDEAGNATKSAPLSVQTPVAPYKNVLTFDFKDNGNKTYIYAATPPVFWTSPKETTDFFFGSKPGAVNNGSTTWTPTSGKCFFEYQFTSDAGKGSMSIRSNTPASDTASTNLTSGRTYIRSNELSNFAKWIYHPDYPSVGQTYVRGVKVDADIELTGDKNGWCAPWSTFPAGGSCAWPYDLWHQASDWGSNDTGSARLFMCVSVGKNKQLTASGHEGYGATGNGAQYFVALWPGNIRDAGDDRIRLYKVDNTTLYWNFAFKDGLGLGLLPEDGSAGGSRDTNGNLCSRDGVIQGKGNRVKLEVGVAPAGGDNESWDIWLTRPDGTRIHVNPATCTASQGDPLSGFGIGGHTFTANTASSNSAGFQDTFLLLGNLTTNRISGVKFNEIKVYNDWNGVGGYQTVNVANLADISNLSVGTPVVIDSTGGEKIATTGIMRENEFATAFFFIEQADRSAGIKVVDRTGGVVSYLVPGYGVSLTGSVGRDADGNLYIDATSGTFTETTQTIAPVAMNNKTIGGSLVTGGSGLANVGLLATVYGTVTSTEMDAFGNIRFALDDGSGTPVNVVDYAYDGQMFIPTAGNYWTATGVIQLKFMEGKYERSLAVDGYKSFMVQ